ncbi:MAG: DUF3298 domain-containing protein [Gammaproteobacteria bacterium]|nr:DUF3298 domain-containing protein [Gammaproteobacteria bacterium]
MLLARCLLLILLLSPLLAVAQTQGEALERYLFTGALEQKYPLQMELEHNRETDAWQGSYFYLNPNTTGEPIQLQGMLDDEGRFQLSEFVEKGDKRSLSGHFSGSFDPMRTQASGIWSSADGKRRLSFSLTRIARYEQRTREQDFRFQLQSADDNCPCYEPVSQKPHACVCRARSQTRYPVLDGPEGGLLMQLLEQQKLLEPSIEASPGDEYPDAGEAQSDVALALYAPPLLSLEVSDYAYNWGAAHGMSADSGLNLLLQGQGKARWLALPDLIRADDPCLGQINALLREELRKQEAPAVLEPDSWSADLSKLYERSFIIRPGGLVFIFPPYDVAPYAMGILKAVVPFRAIAGCIPATSPLAPLMAAAKT